MALLWQRNGIVVAEEAGEKTYTLAKSSDFVVLLMLTERHMYMLKSF